MRRLVLGLLPLFACTPSTSGQPTPQCEREDQCGVVQACLAGQCKDGPIVAALPPLPAPGGAGGVSVAVIQQASQLFTGNAAQGRVGDLLIKNRVSAFVIQQPGREIGPVLFGGNVVDAVPLAPDGTAGPDEFGEVAPLLNLGMGVDFKRWEIIRDGSDGGAAVVRLTGPVSQWDYVNLKAFLTDGFSALVPFDPAEPLAIKVVVTYELRPDEPVLRVTYALHNEGTSARQLPVGVVVDSGGAVEPFRSGGGFGKPSYNAASILEAAKSIPWFGFMGKQSTSAIRPRPVTGEAALDSANPTVQVAGVTVSLFSRPDVLAALAESDFYLRPNEAKSFGFDLAVGGPSLADASAALLRAQQRTTHPFNVTVRTVDNTPVPDAVVLVRAFDDAREEIREPTEAGRTDVNGVAHFETAPGNRRIQVRAEGHPVADPLILTDLDTNVTVTLQNASSLTWRVVRRDNPQSTGEAPGACRVTVVGRDAFVDPALHDVDSDAPPSGVVAVRYSATCNSDDDGSVPLQPGRYLVLVTAGPDFDHVQQLVDVGTTAARVEGTLHRVVEHPGYVSSDWHQHTVNSPDAPITLRDRLVSYLAEGIVLFGGSDHDVVTDWERLVAEYGFSTLVQAINGVEATPFDQGHFNIFPLTVEADKVNGGAVDWAGGEGPNLAPPQMWAAYRQKGAQVIQVNHPRSLGGGFQNYFDRAALTFSFNLTTYTGEAAGDVAAQPATNEAMRLPPLEPMWSAAFDAVEVYNGTTVYPGPPATRRVGDRKADRILLDVGNLTLVGHRPVMLGTSDTHTLKKGENGYPRSYVRAALDAQGQVDRQEVLGALAGLGDAQNRGDVVVSNGPIPLVTVRAGAGVASPGGLLAVADGALTVHVELQAPPWMKVSRVELLVSPHALSGVDESNPTLPVAASQDLPAATVETLPNGGSRQTWTVDVQLDLNATNPFAGKDATVLVRLVGHEVLWPVMLERVALTVDENASTAEEFAVITNGVTAFALTNPVYVDVDGDGRFTGAFESP